MRYTKIHTQIWNDEKFISLTPEQQRLFLYILTSPHSNLIGFYVLKKAYIQGDIKDFGKSFDKDFGKLCSEGLISYDEGLQVILIHKWLKHNQITNPNQIKSAVKQFTELPKTYLLQTFKVLCEGLCEGLYEVLRKVDSKAVPPEEEEETEEREAGLQEVLTASSKNGIPYSDIQSAFNEILSDLPEFRDITDKRRKAIKARWNTDQKTSNLEWWRKEFFPFIAESDFLTGRNGKWTSCNIDWILKPDNFQKIREGTYNR